MNPETLLAAVAVQMKTENKRGLYHAHVCDWHGKLSVLSRQHTKEPHTVFFVLNHRHFTDGLTTEDWNLLKKRLYSFYKEKI